MTEYFEGALTFDIVREFVLFCGVHDPKILVQAQPCPSDSVWLVESLKPLPKKLDALRPYGTNLTGLTDKSINVSAHRLKDFMVQAGYKVKIP